LAYALFNVGPGGTADCSATDICFPIFDDATKYERGSPRRVRGMKQDAIDAINSTKPYKDGNDTLWLLHTLNIIDKHRYLILVGSALQGVDVGAVVSHDFKAAFPQFDSMPILHTFFPPADRKFPLEVDDELYVDAQDAEVNNDMKYEFDVAIDEPGITEGEPLIKTLQDMVDLVDKLVTDFARLLT